jgi:hypothetical protein
LPGCCAVGDTQQEDAIRSWIEAAGDVGHEVPQPSKHHAAASA